PRTLHPKSTIMISDTCEILPLDGVDHATWLSMRGLGGSAVGAIVGLPSKYVSKYSLWAEMTGRVERQGSSAATEWGNRLEDVVGAAYAEENNVAVVKWNVMLKSKERPWATANIDFWICEDPEFAPGVLYEWNEEGEPPGIIAILETKTAGIATHGTAHKWDDGAIPDGYALQAVHYGIVTGIHDLRFGALLAGQGLVSRQLEWDDELALDIIALEDEFWDLVQTDTPPEPDGSDATEEALKQQFPRHEEGTVYEGGEYLAKLWDELDVKKAVEADAIQD